LFVFKINLKYDISKSFSSENVNSKGSDQLGDTGFKTGQRPEAIRNSNIVAAKGNEDYDIEYFSGASYSSCCQNSLKQKKLSLYFFS